MYHDIAMIKVDRPIDISEDVAPICLPKSSYNEIGKFAFIIGQGVIFQNSLHTNGDGPEAYTQCAPGTKWGGKKIKHWDEESRRTG